LFNYSEDCFPTCLIDDLYSIAVVRKKVALHLTRYISLARLAPSGYLENILRFSIFSLCNHLADVRFTVFKVADTSDAVTLGSRVDL
jgi:hypothetical protein